MIVPPAGAPRDLPQWIALALAAIFLVTGARLVRPAPRRALFVAVAALSAAALSAAYVVVYLRGGPRIIDATSYWLEARAFASGHLAWPLDAPEPAVLGRFLVRAEGPSGARVAVIFPPGWPAVLALGFRAGAPLAVGPLLAAAIALVTCDLAARVARDLPGKSPRVGVPELAAIFSVTCAALRYHTADTMSHGLAALCAAGALTLALRAVDASSLRLAAASGFAAGWLAATRPVSALALAPVLVAALLLRPKEPRSDRITALRPALAAALGALPGIALLLVYQRAATGSAALSPQRLYYALADGPPDCFRYGFGAGVGCVGEHGDFVRANLAHGYGALEAAATTLRRLKAHLVDPANLEPLALLVPLGAALAWDARRVRLLALAIGAQILAYAPFYFDGNYPAGGGRFFADVLPCEHVLLAIAVARLAARAREPERWAAGAVALGLAGFALRAGFDHAQLRDREGGRPMFEPAVLARAGVTRGLVFVDTDHGFDLGFDPDATVGRAAAHGGLEVLRLRGDDLDRLAWDDRGRPPAFRYRFAIPAAGPAAVSVEPLVFADEPLAAIDVEGASLWPPLDQRGGWAFPEHAGGTCASGGRWLALHATSPDAPASARVGLPARWIAGGSVAPRVAAGPGVRGVIALVVDGVSARVWPLPEAAPGDPPACADLAPALVPAGARRVELELRREPGPDAPAALDGVHLVRGMKND